MMCAKPCKAEENISTCTSALRNLYAAFPQYFAMLLRIQILLNFGNCITNVVIQRQFALDLFNLVDGCGMVLAAQLTGDFREA
jgi:hypothetical protein